MAPGRDVADLAVGAVVATIGLASTLVLDAGLPRLTLLVGLLLAAGYLAVACAWPGRAGPDGLERIALSLGAAFAVAALVGLALVASPFVFTSDGLAWLLLVSAYALALGAAVRRRALVPAEQFVVRLPALPRGPGAAATYASIAALAVATTTVAYVALVPADGEPFTELFVLGPGGKAGDYPVDLAPGATGGVTIVVANHEGRAATYRLRTTVDGGTQDDRTIEVGDGETRRIPSTFVAPARPGAARVEWDLFLDGETPYRSVHLAIRVGS